MNVEEMAKMLGLRIKAGRGGLDREIVDGYCGDLLSDVMANAPARSVWLTVQGHQNIVAVALLREISAIILVNGHNPDEDTIERANGENVPIFVSDENAFVLSGKLYEVGIGKT